MASDRHLTWENIRGMIAGGIPRRVPIPGSPIVELLIAGAGEEIGLLLPLAPHETISLLPFDELKISRREIDGVERLYLFTQTSSLHREFYSLLLGIADQVQLHGSTASSAIGSQIRAWQRLLRRSLALSSEAEVGLWGELWFLHRLIQSSGPTALDAWVGPSGEPHDFRFQDLDIEVKTTRLRSRRHRINGLGQLVPSVGRRLYLLSLQVQPSGQAGWTLPALALLIRTSIVSDIGRLDTFEATLARAYGLDDLGESSYSTAYELRSLPTLVEVDENCPKLTQQELSGIDQARIEDVEYTVDLEGLGFPENSPEFSEIMSLS